MRTKTEEFRLGALSTALVGLFLLCFASVIGLMIPARKCMSCDFSLKVYLCKNISQMGVPADFPRVPTPELCRRWDLELGSLCKDCRGTHRVSFVRSYLNKEP